MRFSQLSGVFEFNILSFSHLIKVISQLLFWDYVLKYSLYKAMDLNSLNIKNNYQIQYFAFMQQSPPISYSQKFYNRENLLQRKGIHLYFYLYQSTFYLDSQSNQSSSNSNSDLLFNTARQDQFAKQKVSLPYLSKNSKTPDEQPLRYSQIQQLKFPKLETTPKYPPMRQINERKEDPKTKILKKRFFSAVRTKPGETVNKITKVNQDSSIVNPKVLSKNGYYFFAVCDGHGVNGHYVSQFIKKQLPCKFFINLHPQILIGILKAQPRFSFDHSQTQTSNYSRKEKSIRPCPDLQFPRSSQRKTRYYPPTLGTQEQFSLDSPIINGNLSLQRLIISLQNLGKDRESSIEEGVSINLLITMGTIMEQNEFGYPILIFGDKLGIQAGVIAEPEIIEFEKREDDKFIVLASDGVWEYLTNDEVMRIVIPYYEKKNPDQAADKVILEASMAWKKVFFDGQQSIQNSLVRDDITCIVIFF